MTNDNQIDFGRRLSKLRQLNGDTLEQLAQRLGVTKGYLSKIENGHKPVSEDLLRKIVTVYRASYPLIGGQRVVVKNNEVQNEKSYMNTDQLRSQAPEIQLNLNPEKTPIMYSDYQNVASNDAGVVLIFAQSIQPLVAHAVSRIGLSHTQAKELHRVLGENLKRYFSSKDLEY